MKVKDIFKLIILLLIFYFIPKFTIFYLICGIIDFSRSNTWNIKSIRRYFLGNGLFTWLLSPFNLLIDLITFKNYRIFKLQQLPTDCQKEINDMITFITSNSNIISDIESKIYSVDRGMIFFKWYGKNLDVPLQFKEFSKEYKYIRTIGFSVFNKYKSTSEHFGPLRLTYRVLYNINPVKNDNVYIEVSKNKFYWHDNPLFIFDDTLLHKSVNQSDQIRTCMFMDIVRPSIFIRVLDFLLRIVSIFATKINKVFYRNWEFIK